jgi:GNAT superfamily N-acetyltransferase
MMASGKGDRRRSGTIWVRDLDEPLPALSPLLDASFGRASPEDAPRFVDAMGENRQQDVLTRLERGCECYATWVDGKLGAYGWVSFHHEYVGELNLRVRLLPDEAYVWDCFTLPPFRQQGLYSSLLSFILHRLRDAGIRRAWIGADLDNIPSQRGIARAGFHIVADTIIARTLAMRLVWVQGRPGVPETLVTEARRVFLDDRDSVWQRVPLSSRNVGV